MCLGREGVRACALCNCVERSLHGQRELRHFGPSSERPTLEPSESSLPGPGNDDLSSIGLSESCAAALFDDTGRSFLLLNPPRTQTHTSDNTAMLTLAHPSSHPHFKPVVV